MEAQMKSNSKSSKPYRSSVLGVFVNEKNEVLVALRSDTHTWQFPQGGVEEGETMEQALYREMKEEIGCDQFDLILQTQSQLRYDFPEDYKGPKSLTQNYRGQEQYWFLCRFKDGFGPALEKSTCDEFVKTKWVSPIEIASSIVDWKKDTYTQGLTLLGLLKPE
jgi:putative (di)nucleoside polyphosphate hydrolase